MSHHPSDRFGPLQRGLFRGLFVLAAALALGRSLSACGPSCGPTNCDGCCSAAGLCQVGVAATCGKSGSACVACGPFESCFAGVCLLPGNGNGNGTTSASTGASSASSLSSSNSGTASTSAGTHSTGSTGSGTTTTTGTTSTTGTTGTATTTSATSSSSTGTTGAANQPPAIVSLTANPTTLSPGDSTVISAIVSDPDGLGDLAGGTLKSASGQTYGAFSTPGGQGTFTYALSWSAMQALQAFEIPAGGSTQTVQAVFFDNHGHTTTQDLTLAVQCPTAANATCSGSCTDLQTDPSNCGSCGTLAPSGGSCAGGQPKCASGHTNCGGTCLNTKGDVNNCGGCGITCSAWASAHGVGTTHLGCDFSACVHYEDQASASSCTALCAAVGTGLSCFARSSCHTVTGANSAFSNGACGSYGDPGGTVCINEEPLACDDVPAATVSDCHAQAGGVVTGTFLQTFCSCSG